MHRMLLIVLSTLLSSPVVAGVPLVELKTDNQTYHGRVLAQDSSTAFLLGRDGVIHDVPLGRVTDFGIAATSFRPYEARELRSRLQDMTDRDVEVVASRHFIVAGRAQAARVAALALEETHDQYRYFCSTHNLPLSEPEFPLVALVMPNAAAFREYCATDGVVAQDSLAGYYRETTNRFVCYESESTPEDPIAGVRDTLTHEAVHQLAFNTGLHARMGSNPTWIVEGLATTLEPEGIRRPFQTTRRLDRVNPERYYRVLRIIGETNSVSVRAIVASDTPFAQSPLHSYATAWAMTFYLLETRPGDYLRYLRKIAARPMLEEYTSAARVDDFGSAFGRDIARFERELADYFRRLSAGERR